MKTCCSEWAWNCLFFACLAPALSGPLFNHLQVFQSVYSSFLGTNLLVIRMPRSIVPSLRPLPFVSLTWFQGPSLPQMPRPHQLKAFSMTAAKYSHSGCYVLWFAPGILFFNVQHIQNASYQSIRHLPSNIWLIQEKHVYHFSSWKIYKYIMDHFLNLESIKKKIKIANNSSLLLPRELLLRCHSISFQSFFFFNSRLVFSKQDVKEYWHYQGKADTCCTPSSCFTEATTFNSFVFFLFWPFRGTQFSIKNHCKHKWTKVNKEQNLNSFQYLCLSLCNSHYSCSIWPVR